MEARTHAGGHLIPMLALWLAATLSFALAPSSTAAQANAAGAEGEGSAAVPYLPESWSLDNSNHFIVGTMLLGTDETTAVPELPRDLLFGLSLAYRWSWFELATQFLAGLNWLDGLEQMRFYAALTPRAAIPIADLGFLDLEVTYGLGLSFELKASDDYALFYFTPAELGLLVWDRGSWHITLLGSLRILLAGVRLDGLPGQTVAIYPEVTDAKIAELLERRVGFTAGIALTREL